MNFNDNGFHKYSFSHGWCQANSSAAPPVRVPPHETAPRRGALRNPPGGRVRRGSDYMQVEPDDGDGMYIVIFSEYNAVQSPLEVGFRSLSVGSAIIK